MPPAALRGALLACLMKLLSKFVEKRFTIQDPAKFHLTNDTTVVSSSGNSEICIFNSSLQAVETDNQMSLVTSWIYTTRYILPVLGGLLSSAWLGYIRVLQIGGVIMLLSAVLMSVSVYLGLMCQSSPMIPITWLMLLLFFGLIQPNVQYGIFRWNKQGKACTIVAALYVTTASIGEWTGLLMSSINELGNHLTLLFIAPSVLFIALSSLLPKESDEPFEMPTSQRMNRYFRIFSGLILFLISVSDTRSMMYVSELKYYLNDTSYLESHPWLSPDWIKFFSLIFLTTMFMLITYIIPRELPLQSRMQAGILLESAVAMCLMIFTIVGSTSETIIVAVYSVASILDATAEALVMVAAYDLGNRIAPSNSQAFVMGIMFTVWGLANIASRLWLMALNSLPAEHRVLHPTAGVTPHFYAYHLIALVALILCSIYHKFVTFPQAMQLIPSPDGDGDDDGDDDAAESDDVRRPLLTPTDA